jgi:diguanylate cyclase (GGDEF)-like protein
LLLCLTGLSRHFLESMVRLWFGTTVTTQLHIISALLLGGLILLPTLVRFALGIPFRMTRSRKDQALLDRATQVLAGAIVVDAPLLRTLRDHLSYKLPILHIAIWDDAHQVSTGPCDALGPPAIVIELANGRGEIQLWLTNTKTCSHTKRIFLGLLPWIQAALQSSSAFKTTERDAITDPLTGLGNRRVLYAERRKYAETGDSYGIFLLDLNDFKAINDTWDHQLGDQALVRFTEILQSCTRQTDTLIRAGGDEFLIIAQNASPEGMMLLGERIALATHRHRLELPNGMKQRLSASLGWACYPSDGDNWEDLIALADRRMYSHKAEQKGAVA